MFERAHGGRDLFVIALVLASNACTTFGSEPAADAGVPDAKDALDAADAALPASCRALLVRDPSLRGKSAIYAIAPGDAAALSVYCNMTLDDGGWTLAGRSGVEVPGLPLPFGWSSATGDVHEPKRPYSLNVVASQIAFTDVLVATSDGRHAFKFPVVDRTFLAARDPASTGTVIAVAGDCAPPKGPSMLKYTGATNRTDVFFFRDISDVGQLRGLKPAGFDLAYSDCISGGALDGAQGMIMIR